MGVSVLNGRNPSINATTAAIDLAKNVFQVALADSNGRVLEQHRLTRAQFERFFENRSVSRMEAIVTTCCKLQAHRGDQRAGRADLRTRSGSFGAAASARLV